MLEEEEEEGEMSDVAYFYYYDKGGTRRGPIPAQGLVALASSGGQEVDGDTFVWTPSMSSGWAKFADVDALKGAGGGAITMTSHPHDKDKVIDDGKETSLSTVGDGGCCTGENAKSSAAASVSKKRKRKKKRGANRWVYATGLPPTATEATVAAYFKKCGILQIDPSTRNPRVKLYRDDSGNVKGDCSVAYEMRPSIEIALKILDGADFEPGFPLAVSEAVFKVNSNPNDRGSKPKLVESSQTSATKERFSKMRKLETKQKLSWNEVGVGDHGGLTVVVLKGMFTLEEMKENDALMNELEEDIVAECSKCGELKKITVFEKHPDGVVVVNFRSSVSAEKCIQMMDRRWYARRQLSADYWDGFTDYTVKNRDEEGEAARIKAFGDWLDREEEEEAEDKT